MKEKELAKRLADSDPKALGKAVDEFSSYVRTVARNVSRGALSKEDIDEIAVEVFYKLWNSRETLKEDIGIRPYLSAIARNAVKDRFKHSSPICEDISGLDLPVGFSLEEEAEMNEMMSCLDEGMKQLSEEEREIFFRYYFYGERLSEISEVFGITENAAHTRLSRTRNKLKKYLMERGFGNV